MQRIDHKQRKSTTKNSLFFQVRGAEIGDRWEIIIGLWCHQYLTQCQFYNLQLQLSVNMREKLKFWQVISPTEVQWHRKSTMQVSKSEISLFKLTSIKFVKWLNLELHIMIWHKKTFGLFILTKFSKSANRSAMKQEINDAGQEFSFYFLFTFF